LAVRDPEEKVPHTPTLTGAARDVLTQQEAADRATRVRQAEYDIKLDLVGGQETYRGDTTIRFAAQSAGDTFLDFRGKQIELLEINDEPLEPNWNGYRLTLPGSALASENMVRVVYVNDYDTTGDGFHRFVDPEDDEEYVYTNFEPYEAHRLFPSFDQPDIKGKYTVTVTAWARDDPAAFKTAPTVRRNGVTNLLSRDANLSDAYSSDKRLAVISFRMPESLRRRRTWRLRVCEKLFVRSHRSA